MTISTLASEEIAAGEPPLISAYPEPLSPGATLHVPVGMGTMIICDGKPLDLLRPGQYTLDYATTPLLAQALQSNPGGQISAVLLPTPGMVSMAWSAPMRGHTTKRGNLEYMLSGLVRVKIADPYRFYEAFASAWTERKAQMTESEAETAKNLSLGRIAEIWISHFVGKEASAALAVLLLPVEQLVNPSNEEYTPVAHAAAQWLGNVGLECTGLTLNPATVTQYGGCDRCGRLDRPSNKASFQRYYSFFLFTTFEKVEHGAFCTPCAAWICGSFNTIMFFLGLLGGWRNLFRIPVTIVMNTVAFFHVASVNSKMRS